MYASRLCSFQLLRHQVSMRQRELARRITYKLNCCNPKNLITSYQLPFYVTPYCRHHALPKRLYSTSHSHSGSVLAEATINLDQREDHLSIAVDDKTVKLSYLWLRDHCRCSECYEHDCNENFVDIVALDPNIKPKHVDFHDDGVQITWPDDHVSNYSIEWLQDNAPGQRSSDMRKLQPFLWDKNKLASNPPKDVTIDALREGTGLRELLENLHVYGFSFVTGMEASKESTEEAVDLICPVMRTFYGDLCTFQNDGEIADAGYTAVALKSHTDTTYFSNPAGAMILHCIKHTGTGGESVLVDGFHAAHRLKETAPEHYNALLNLQVIGHYLDKHRNLRAQHTVLQENTLTEELEHIRFNPHDRATLSYMSYDDAEKYYAAYRALGRFIDAPDSEFRVKLNPDAMMVFDNWRMLHGRTAFTGSRVMACCYFGRDDIQSLKRRVANLSV